MDVKTAFLNENLDEEVFMDQPEGFVVATLEPDPTRPGWQTRTETLGTPGRSLLSNPFIKYNSLI